MLTRRHHQEILASIAKSYTVEQRPSYKEMKALLKLCVNPREETREAALILLLHPPVPNELEYFKWLVAAVLARTPKIGRLPPVLLHFLCDRAAFLLEFQHDDSLERFFSRLLKSLPKRSIRTMFHNALPLHPFVPHLSSRSLPHLFNTSSKSRKTIPAAIKRRWHLLTKRLLTMPSSSPETQLTMKDLAPAWEQSRIARRLPFRKGRWLRAGRPILLPPARTPTGTFLHGALEPEERSSFNRMHRLPSIPFENIWWEGRGQISALFWEALLNRQVEELRAVRRLARQVSQTTRRVVLSWHNATLAAAGGWGFEDLGGQFPSTRLREAFLQAVQKRVLSEIPTEGAEASGLEHLWRLWEKRLVIPKIVDALWESRIRTLLGAQPATKWERDMESAVPFLDDETISLIRDGTRYGWHGTVSPHQLPGLKQTLAWRDSRRQTWEGGFHRLASLIHEGQHLLDSGDLPHLVLPWIDKFFISSRREEDLRYLPSVIQWLERQGVQPLVLFWEDSARVQSPSFQLALERLRKEGLPFRGIGVFDTQGSRRTDALTIILKEHSTTRLFALRPCSDAHYGRSFPHLLEELDYGFFRAYDSSWKDNLSFLYAGTQVFPLLSVQHDMEQFSSWIAWEGVRCPFGTYFRWRLRREIVGKENVSNGFSTDYARWANLL